MILYETENNPDQVQRLRDFVAEKKIIKLIALDFARRDAPLKLYKHFDWRKPSAGERNITIQTVRNTVPVLEISKIYCTDLFIQLVDLTCNIVIPLSIKLTIIMYGWSVKLLR